MSESAGHLVIIGGGEDREEDKTILTRFVELAGGAEASIVVLTAASRVPGKMWDIYNHAYADLGVARRHHLHIESRAAANDPGAVALLDQASGVFMTGGDQKRLLSLLGGTALDDAMHRALVLRGACIGGTSAGASAMSGHMLADGKADLHPEKGGVSLGAGLGFLHRVVIDQHFSERNRLARLLSVVAANPYLLGIGIDEDTALVIQRGAAIEVIGQGAVTIVDGRDTISNIADLRRHECPELIDVRLHLLPSGSRYALEAGTYCGAETPAAPEPLKNFLEIVTKRNPLS